MENAACIAEVLEDAARCLRVGELEKATWRVADAGLMLRVLCEGQGKANVIGLDCPTGIGAMLPVDSMALPDAVGE